jgi:hypothetical protein
VRLCRAPGRDDEQLCVVESPADLIAIEQATGYRGRYFVLHGRLSPLDGRGPRELGLDALARRLAEGEVRELIVATNPTVEGEATAHYLSQIAKHRRRASASRLAHGVPRRFRARMKHRPRHAGACLRRAPAPAWRAAAELAAGLIPAHVPPRLSIPERVTQAGATRAHPRASVGNGEWNLDQDR